MQRNDIINQFLHDTQWGQAKRVLIAGDASFRKYYRVSQYGKSAIVMDAPPDKEDIRPFMAIDAYLQQHQLSAPCILASDTGNGLLLLEDLGDDLFARVLAAQPEKELELYQAAADVLIELHNYTLNYAIPAFDKAKMLSQVALLPEWFMPLVSGKEAEKVCIEEYTALWNIVLNRLPPLKNAMVLYDFHAENLLWLPGRMAVKRVGLLDFQDAMLGSPAYDMVSFLEDARRDVSQDTIEKVIAYYLDKTQIAEEEFMTAYAIMGAQRNCRIAGTFARLNTRDNKPRYLAFMQRVWNHIEKDVSHPALRELKNWLDRYILPEWRV